MMERFRKSLGTLLSSVALLALLLASFHTIRITIADWRFREGDLPGIESAELLMPSNARYHFAHALAVQQQDPTSATVDRELARAVFLNPRFSDAMLSWSVDREFSGDKKGAEQLLLDAHRIDRLLRPSWALANFYYRQGDAARFWPEARECLRMIGVFGFTTGRYDPIPVFQLCWSMEPNAAKILSQAIPSNPQIEQIYLTYLLKNARIDAQVALVARMLPSATSSDLWVFIPHINALIGAGRAETAVHEWNELIDRKLLPYNKLDPASGSSLTDGSFQAAPSGSGFDWRTLYPESIRFSFMESEHTYRFDFDGTAPQQADLLSQLVPLLPNRTYQLRSRYHAGFDAAKSGIHWAVNINNQSIPVRLAGTDTTIVAEFRTPDQTTAGNLVLSYARQPGTTLIHGPFDLLQTSLNLL
jgi:hypothetical protein